MKLQVLVDNSVISYEENLKGEHGLSVFIKDGDKKILFDCGATNLLFDNAKILQVDLNDLDYVVLSHHHYDHVGALKPLEGKFQLIEGPRSPLWLTDKLVFLGTIERKFSFECDDEYSDLQDDSALAYLSSKGLIIITGCSHSGICNIVEYAKKVTGENRIIDVFGGLHLIDPSEEKLKKTIGYLQKQNLSGLHPGHCTDFKSRAKMAEKLPVENYGVGLEAIVS